jgi:hypothetical protein
MVYNLRDLLAVAGSWTLYDLQVPYYLDGAASAYADIQQQLMVGHTYPSSGPGSTASWTSARDFRIRKVITYVIQLSDSCGITVVTR